MSRYFEYAKHVMLDQYGLDWVTKVVGAKSKKQELSTEEVEHIIDWLASDDAPDRVGRMSYEQAKISSQRWLKSQIKKGSTIKELPTDIECVLDFGDGFKIVKLIGENAYKREGFLMSHCVAGYYGRDVDVYSLRDAENMPHCTMEKGQQIKGKGNGDIHPRYVGYVVKFLEYIGMSVGDSEMLHIGYVNVGEFKDELSSDLFNGKYHPKNKKLIAKDGEEFVDLALLGKIPLIEFSSNVDFKINFDLSSFITKAVTRLFAFAVSLKSSNETAASGDYSKLAASGDYSKLAASGDGSQLAASGYCSQLAASGYGSKLAASGYGSQLAASGDGSKLAASGDCSQLAASGDGSQLAASGDYSKLAASWDYSKLAASGDYSQLAASGDGSQLAASGYCSKLAASGYGSQLAASGDYSKLAASGYCSQLAASGDGSQLELNGGNSVGMAAGRNGKIKGKTGCWITLAEWQSDENNYVPVCVKSAKIDGVKLKEDVFYKLVGGEFVEVE